MIKLNSRIARTIATISFTLATIQLWSLAVHAKPVAPEYRVPGHCVVTTEINDDGSIVTRQSCEFSKADYDCLKATGKVCKAGK